MGVSAAALAATCEMESQCQNAGAAPGGSATGAFQMINATYTADINGAIAEDPSIAGSIVSGLAGRMDRVRRPMQRLTSFSRMRNCCRGDREASDGASGQGGLSVRRGRRPKRSDRSG